MKEINPLVKQSTNQSIELTPPWYAAKLNFIPIYVIRNDD